MGPTWVLSAPDGPHVGPMNLAIRDGTEFTGDRKSLIGWLLDYLVYRRFRFRKAIYDNPAPSSHWRLPLKRKCLHFDEIFITGCTESCQNDNFRCSQWWNFHQNDDIFVSVSNQLTMHLKWGSRANMRCSPFYTPVSLLRNSHNRHPIAHAQPIFLVIVCALV